MLFSSGTHLNLLGICFVISLKFVSLLDLLGCDHSSTYFRATAHLLLQSGFSVFSPNVLYLYRGFCTLASQKDYTSCHCEISGSIQFTALQQVFFASLCSISSYSSSTFYSDKVVKEPSCRFLELYSYTVFQHPAL